MDGEALSSSSSVGSVIKNSAESTKVGENLGGGVDELRISDIARYTGSTYTRPTSPLTCDEHTRALWHFDELGTHFHDACGTTDNLLIGHNGACNEGVIAHQVYLPLAFKQY